ncbi:hypothetical protein WJX77_000943 [Trebouxia sp. C0004]
MHRQAVYVPKAKPCTPGGIDTCEGLPGSAGRHLLRPRHQLRSSLQKGTSVNHRSRSCSRYSVIVSSALGQCQSIQNGVHSPIKLQNPNDLLNWRVVNQKQQLLGTVQEVIQPQEALGGTCPLVRIQLQTAATADSQRYAGREDLIKRVISAGGFIRVAHLLGLRAKRKPEGYWDEPENMDRELSLFVASTWTCLHDASSDEPYYYNQVTGRTQWDLPQTPQSIPLDDAGTFIFAEADADRVMPSRSAVLAAGRFDLHHGIMYQGGYKATAAALDRPHTWPRHKKFNTAAQLAEEVQVFNREEGLPIDFIPTANVLRGAERHDLLTGIRQYGGALTLAPQIGMKTQRGSGFHSTVSVATELLKFVKNLPKDKGDTRQSWVMPSIYQLRHAGRHDLAAGIYKFGLGQVAQAANLKYNRTRKSSQVQPNN